MAELPVTELPNELSAALEAQDSLGFVRTLRACDAQIFGGYRQYPGALDAGPLARAEKAAQLAAAALKSGGVVALTGCGTSGRVAHLVARRHERLARARAPGKKSFDYLMAGGDAALLLSDELPEDDAARGAQELEALASKRSACVVLGTSCGLSANYVAGQVAFALTQRPLGDAPSVDPVRPLAYAGEGGWAGIALGFNPARLARAAFRDVATTLEAAPRNGVLVNPVIGPEAVAGSSRMKGGTATLAILDAVCARAGGLARDESAPAIAEALHAHADAVARAYTHASDIAKVCDLAAATQRCGGRLCYVGEGTAGVLGCLDASEMPDTFGVPFDAVRGFVCGGWSDVANREGDLRGRHALLRLSLADFEALKLGPKDAVVLLGCCAERDGASDNNFDGMCSERLLAAGEKCRARGVKVALVAVAKDASLKAKAQGLDAAAVIVLPRAGLMPGHGGLAAVALKIALNCVSTFAMARRGLVFGNRMVGVSPTNDKIYHRCVKLVAELAKVDEAAATDALIRAVHGVDRVAPELAARPTVFHVEAATPAGDAVYEQQVVLPTAILLAADASLTVADAEAALKREPRVAELVRARASLVPADASKDIVVGLDLGATSVKAAAFGADGEALGPVSRAPLEVKTLDGVVGALAAAARACDVPWARVRCVGLSLPGAVSIFLDDARRGAHPRWSRTRASSEPPRTSSGRRTRRCGTGSRRPWARPCDSSATPTRTCSRSWGPEVSAPRRRRASSVTNRRRGGRGRRVPAGAGRRRRERARRGRRRAPGRHRPLRGRGTA